MADGPQSEVQRYLPHHQRAGIALCLSGGGYRAALFHLGALTRLNELGALGQLDAISAVSGGSILAAHLAQQLRPWPQQRVDDWQARVIDPFRAFTRKNIRTLWVLRRGLPWNWADSTVAVESLVSRYQRDITQLALPELPSHPEFVFCATDMAFGGNWVSERSHVGSYLAGYAHPDPPWPVARAVAASSCFPPAFEPMRLRLAPEAFAGGHFGSEDGEVALGAHKQAERDRLIRGLRLTDGGVYDNMAVEPVWKTKRVVLVSDGGATFDFKPDAGPLKRIARYEGIQGRQAAAVRKRWLIASFQQGLMSGAYWGIGSDVTHYEHGGDGYSAALVDDVISEVRTDLDYFAEAEAAVLQNHGYWLADAAMRSHMAELCAPDAPAPSWPYEQWRDEQRVRDAMRKSAKRAVLGRWRILQRLRGRA